MMYLISLLIALCVAGLASTQSVNNCPTSVPRDQHTLVFKDSCYQFVVYRKRDYTHALSDCKSRTGTLAQPKTKDVQQFLQSTAVSLGIQDPLWIGLNDKGTENTFEWEDGTVLDDNLSHWADGSGPRAGAVQHRLEDCVAMDTARDGQWVDYHCDNELFGLFNYEKYYICSFKLSL